MLLVNNIKKKEEKQQNNAKKKISKLPKDLTEQLVFQSPKEKEKGKIDTWVKKAKKKKSIDLLYL